MPNVVLGVDIGAAGAVALLTGNGALIDAFDMPVLRDGPANRRAVNGPLLADLVVRSHATHAFVEMVGARPGEGPAGAFAFGRSFGTVFGVLAALSIPITLIAPASWKRVVGLPAGREGAKDRSRSEAIRRWPDKAAMFARVKDDGRSDAALIGAAGLMRESSLSLQSKSRNEGIKS